MKVKNIPNMLSVLRIVLSLSLQLFFGNSTVFLIIIIICGLSDLFDGIIARKTNSQSELGARLDSIADLVFFFNVLFCVALSAWEGLLTLLPYIAAIASIRFANLAIAFARFHKFAIIHTYLNKAAGLLVFVSFVAFILTGAIIAFIPVCGVAALSALEETLILLTAKELDLDRKSIFTVRRQ